MIRPTPRISVIVPAYNCERTLGGTLTGLLTQTYPDVEIVVVDDGSTDRSAAIARAFGDLIVFDSIPNQGSGPARNHAMELASGSFIALCDADDVLLPRHLEKAMEAWRHAGGGRRFVASNARLLTPSGITHGRDLGRYPLPQRREQRLRILEANFVPVFTLGPREMFTEVGGFGSEEFSEDWDIWVRAVFAGWEAVGQPEPHALYRWSSASKTTNAEENFDADEEVLARIQANRHVLLTPAEQAYLTRRLSSGSPRRFQRQGDLSARAGDRRDARANYRAAVRLLPHNTRLRWKARFAATPPTALLLRQVLNHLDTRLGRNPTDPR
ncbi:MAG: glycosyltransferase family 2 protein [Nostocoides sp.]